MLFLTTSAQATDAGGRTRILSEIRAVQRHDVHVLLVFLVPPRQLLTGAIRASRRRMPQDLNLKAWYVPLPPLRRILGLRHIGEALIARRVARLCRRFGIRIIHVHRLRASMIALTARSLDPHLRVVADIHGVSPEEKEYATGDQRSRTWVEAQERHVLEESDRLVYVSHRMAGHYREKYGLNRSDVSVVPCATDSTFLLSPRRRDRVRRDLGLEGATLFCYLGTYRRYQMIEETFTVFRKVAERLPEAHLLVITPDRERIGRALSECGVPSDRCRMLTLDHERVLETLEAADLGFLLRADSPVNHVASPTKFAEYCIAGVPVITTPYVGDFSEAVKQVDIGTVVDPDHSSIDDLVEFARQVVARRDEFATRCHDYARDHLSWSRFGPVLRELYDSFESKESS